MNKDNIIIKKISENKILQYILIAVLSIIIIVIVSVVFNKKTKNVETTYSSILEEKLEDKLSSIKGVGDVEVIITVGSENIKEIAYTTVTEKTIDGTKSTKTPLLVNGKTVELGESTPEILGIVIIAEGANDIFVMSKLQQATTTLLNVEANKIEVLPMK